MSSNDAGTICKVSIRTPPFWPEEPALWFSQLEAQFALSGISADTTKFYHVVGQLEHQYALEVKDIINAPPDERKYDKLKTELIARLSATQEQRSLQLMKHEELGDRKPSQFLRHLRTLAGTSVTDEFLKTVWAMRLPSNLQTVIASQTKATLEEVADLADKVHDIAPQTPHVCAVNDNAYLSEMARQMAELTREVASLKAQFNTQAPTQMQPSHSQFTPRARSELHRRSEVGLDLAQGSTRRFAGTIKDLEKMLPAVQSKS